MDFASLATGRIDAVSRRLPAIITTRYLHVTNTLFWERLIKNNSKGKQIEQSSNQIPCIQEGEQEKRPMDCV